MSIGGPVAPADQVAALCATAARLTANGPLAATVAQVRDRLEGPLRVAIAGRVKAGKSTLLNALVGERLAPTDAGECTRVVTWYAEGIGYEVAARDREGRSVPLSFRRVEGALDVDLGGLAIEAVERIEVAWPSSALRQVTLIDTPGLASLDDENSLRTREFLAFGQGRPSDADAVIYLMRHLHRSDAEFMGAFLDRSVAGASPVNAVAVLSRADEIGAGRLDAMTSAARIAERYQLDPDVRALCTAVVPVAGLLAETGLTIREDEVAALRTLAATPDELLEWMLLSVDTFCAAEASELTIELRRQLLNRLGLFGVRLCVTELRAQRVQTAADVARLLVDRSGLGALRALIADHFLPQAHTLKARSALSALRQVAALLIATDPAGGARELASDVERCEATTPAFAQLRLAHLVRSGLVLFSDAEQSEVGRVTDDRNSLAGRLALAAGSNPAELKAAALGGVERWRTRAGDPFAGSDAVEACETMARAYESAYIEASSVG